MAVNKDYGAQAGSHRPAMSSLRDTAIWTGVIAAIFAGVIISFSFVYFPQMQELLQDSRRQVNSLEANVVELRKEVESINDNLNTNNQAETGSLGNLENAIESLASETNDLRILVGALSKDVVVLKQSDIGSLKESVNKDITSLREHLGSLEGQISHIGDSTDLLARDISDLKQKELSSLKESMVLLNIDVSNLKEQLNDISSRLEDHEKSSEDSGGSTNDNQEPILQSNSVSIDDPDNGESIGYPTVISGKFTKTDSSYKVYVFSRQVDCSCNWFVFETAPISAKTWKADDVKPGNPDSKGNYDLYAVLTDKEYHRGDNFSDIGWLWSSVESDHIVVTRE